MRDDLADPPLPPEAATQLRFLRALVTGLALVMGLGMVAIVVLLWLRLSPAVPVLPERLALPEGASVAAVTQARGFTVIVTEAGEVLLYDSLGALRQTVVPAP